MLKNNFSKLIKQEAQRLGFFQCGIAKAAELVEDAKRLEKWLSNNFNGNMHYMENHFEKRTNPTKLVDNAQSVITLLFNYFPSSNESHADYKVSKYALGEDYHVVIRDKLNALMQFMQQEIGDIHGRGFVDSAPVLERAWAVKSGAGWIGKNGNLISKKNGSFFFIATLIVDVALDYDIEFQTDHCGSCTKCIEACPTDAILPNKEINGSQCISYYTIELKDALIETSKSWDNWIFGCDICQDVCPWNRFAKPSNEERFQAKEEIITFSNQDWEEITEDVFKKVFHDSPIKRSKLSGLKRNISFLKK